MRHASLKRLQKLLDEQAKRDEEMVRVQNADKQTAATTPDPEPVLIVPEMAPKPSPGGPNAPPPLITQDDYNSSDDKAGKEEPTPQ